jgi:hypothetical protein
MIVDISVIDTTPGKGGMFCPPSGISTADEYRRWLRDSCDHNPALRQFMAVAARTTSGVREIVGQFGPALQGCLADLARKSRAAGNA